MLRLSKMADYAVVVLVRLAHRGEHGTEDVQTSPGIAAATGLPEPTVAKVLKALSAGGLVVSQRGARGGYRLLRPLSAIQVSDVVSAIDGPVHLTACVDGSNAPCETTAQCSCRGGWDKVNEVVMQALGTISLADIASFQTKSGSVASSAVDRPAVARPAVARPAVAPPAVARPAFPPLVVE